MSPAAIRAAMLGLAALVVTSAAAAEPPRPGSIVTEQRSFTTTDGEVVPYELGTLYVAENRGRSGSRVISVGFARFKGTGTGGALPSVHLPGGPGNSYVAWLNDGTELSRRLVTKMLLPFRAAGDVVLVDQRGFSTRGEMLSYPERPVGQPLDRPASLPVQSRAWVDAVRAALAAHPDKDLSGYTVLACADDVDELRRALGYTQVVLVGQSFGSQWSLAVLQRHPGMVARALLSGVEPLDNAYDMPSHIFAALQRIAGEAEQDPRLKPYLPAGGLMAAVRTVRARLQQAPVKVQLPGDKAGQQRTIVLGPEDFQQALLAPAAEWPALVLSLYHRHYDDWARAMAKLRARSERPSALIGPLIDTSLGVTPERAQLLQTDPALEFLGAWDFAPYMAAAPYMPTPDLGDAFRRPVPSAVPVLFVHGDWDTSTPIENSQKLLPYFANGHLLQVHRGGHPARISLFQQDAPVVPALLEFVRSGKLGEMPVDVALPPPDFRVPSFPAPAVP